ncbi:hypothetical protein IFM89_004257 [Coptis chinensis]|uniref:Uncharacterized protein n=1 Tax=Coptis chinensis TaxID=261450 RepID=A0A835M1F3_9MAGN|nr:hypothetical protein IFM89_004257 [Coptis chinensis]
MVTKDYGVKDSWTRLHTVRVPNQDNVRPLVVRRNGGILLRSKAIKSLNLSNVRVVETDHSLIRKLITRKSSPIPACNCFIIVLVVVLCSCFVVDSKILKQIVVSQD